MITDIVPAAHVEVTDFISRNGHILEVLRVEDEGEMIFIHWMDEEGERDGDTFAPFDFLSVITSFEEEVDFEDVPIED